MRRRSQSIPRDSSRWWICPLRPFGYLRPSAMHRNGVHKLTEFEPGSSFKRFFAGLKAQPHPQPAVTIGIQTVPRQHRRTATLIALTQ